MIRLKQAVIVEGKYDKIKLDNLIDGLIIPTNGFEIFKDKDKLNLIRRLAKTRGIVIMTDSDSAGFKIRNYIGGSLSDGEVYHAYIPDLFGKEKRKAAYSSEGKLGVEGIPKEAILSALERAGVYEVADADPSRRRITKNDLYFDGFTGGKDSKSRRLALLKALDLPERLSTNAMLDIMNAFLSYEEYREIVERLSAD